MKVNFAELPAAAHLPAGQALVLTVSAASGKTGAVLGPLGRELDNQSGGQLGNALKASPRFTGAHGEILTIVAPAGTRIPRILLLGLGDPARLARAHDCQLLGGAVAKTLAGTGDMAAALIVDAPKNSGITANAIAQMAGGVILKTYRFDKYRTTQTPEQRTALDSLTVHCADTVGAKKSWRAVEAMAQGMIFTRDLGNEPPNVLVPIEAAARATRELTKLGVTVEVLDEKQLAKLGFGLMLAVGQASVNPPRLVICTYNGAGTAKGKNSAPIALCGKGVTFDTGGVKLKPDGGLGMKFDMCGAGAVLGAMKTLAARKAKVNVVGLCGFVENSIGSKAFRQDDVLVSLSGKTIENQNTDAEGRLVLADVITYAQQRFKPRAIFDFATLTGGAIVALGYEYAAIMGNDDDAIEMVREAGRQSGDKVWPLPLDPAFDRDLVSTIADMKNIGRDRDASSIIGATFIASFVDKNVPWVHVDIAGTASTGGGAENPLGPMGATGFGVRLIDALIAENYES